MYDMPVFKVLARFHPPSIDQLCFCPDPDRFIRIELSAHPVPVPVQFITIKGVSFFDIDHFYTVSKEYIALVLIVFSVPGGELSLYLPVFIIKICMDAVGKFYIRSGILHIQHQRGL